MTEHVIDLNQTVPLSRSGSTHFMGKCSTELQVPLPQEMRDDLAAVARINGTTPAELTRSLLTDWLYGRKVQMDRIVKR